jgi:hypothetical protein
MPHISMKKLYGLAYAWIVEEDSQGPSHKEAHRQVAILTDELDFVWKHK